MTETGTKLEVAVDDPARTTCLTAAKIRGIIREKCYIPPEHGTPFVKVDDAAQALEDWLKEHAVWEGETELIFYKEILPVLAMSPFEDHGNLEQNVRYRTIVFPWREDE